LKKINGFPTGVSLNNTPTKWTHMPALTVDRGLWHFLEWRTTATVVMDCIRTGDTRYTKEVSSPAASLWSQLDEIAFNQILAAVHVDHLGRLFIEIDPLLTPEADRDYPVVMEIEHGDIEGKIEVGHRLESEVGQVNLSGISVTLGGVPKSYFALAPGHIPDRTGAPLLMDRLLLRNQAQANELAALLFSARNNEFAALRLALKANNSLITCFPNQAITFALDGAYNPRGLSTSGNWIPRRRTLSYNSKEGFWETKLELEGESLVGASSNGDVPGSSGNPDVPPIPPIPPLPPLPLPLPGGTPVTDAGPPKVLVHDPTAGLIYTENFNTDDPDWAQVNSGLTETQYQSINRMFKTPNGAIYVANLAADNSTFLARAPSVGSPFVIIEDVDSIKAKFGSSLLGPLIRCVNYNPLASEEVAYVVGCNYDPSVARSKVYRGLFGIFSEAAAMIAEQQGDNGGISYGAGKWLYTSADGYYAVLSADCSAVEDEDTHTYSYLMGKHIRAGTTDITYHWEDFDNKRLIVGTDNFTNKTEVGTDVYARVENQEIIASDPTGLLLMGRNGSNSTPGKSTDGGASWSVIGGLPLSLHYFAWAGSGEEGTRWISASAYVYLSLDGGATWVNKYGNILSIAPLLTCDAVTVIEF